MGLFDTIGGIAKKAIGFTPLGAVVDSTMAQSENMPTYQAPELDSQTKGLLQSREALANKTPEQIALERMQGVDKSADLGAIRGGMAIQNSNLESGTPENIKAALVRKADRGYAQSLTKVKRQAGLDAVDEQQQARQQVLQSKFRKAQSDANIMHQRDMEEFNTRAARNNALSSLLGTGMGIAGTLVGAPGAGQALAPKQQSYDTGMNTASAGGRSNTLSATV